MKAERIGVVVLAAGAATRFGSSKLTAPTAGVPLVRRTALAALGASAHVVVVTGAHRAAVEACIADLAVERVFNPGWAEGMGSSIACGIAALPASCEAAIVVLADQALVDVEGIAALIAAHERAPERIIAAQYDGVHGPPCLFPRGYFDELARLDGDQGARALLERHCAQVDAVSMPDAATDIDTREDYERLTQAAAKMANSLTRSRS